MRKPNGIEFGLFLILALDHGFPLPQLRSRLKQ